MLLRVMLDLEEARHDNVQISVMASGGAGLVARGKEIPPGFRDRGDPQLVGKTFAFLQSS